MIRPGLCSIGFARFAWSDVLSHAAQAGLEAIEWSALHVAAGATALAGEVGRRTRDAGLATCSYGSYYRAGIVQKDLSFEAVLDTALALGAPTVRIWAGNRDAEEVDDAQRALIINDVARIADLAAQAGVAVGFEYHPGTLTNSPQSTDCLMREIPHAAVRFYWQTPFGRSPQYCLDSLRRVLPRLAHLHVFHWTVGAGVIDDAQPPDLKSLVWPQDYHRHPLSDGADCWRTYLACAATSAIDHWALLEFTKGDDWGQLAEDARSLAALLSISRT